MKNRYYFSDNIYYRIRRSPVFIDSGLQRNISKPVEQFILKRIVVVHGLKVVIKSFAKREWAVRHSRDVSLGSHGLPADKLEGSTM